MLEKAGKAASSVLVEAGSSKTNSSWVSSCLTRGGVDGGSDSGSGDVSGEPEGSWRSSKE